MLTLYEHPLSAYVMKVKIALHEKGLEFQAILPDGLSTGTTSGAFVEASPRVVVTQEVVVRHAVETNILSSERRGSRAGPLEHAAA